MNYVFVFAHPDDEFCVAGIIQKYIREGNEVSLICATRGEAGRIRNLKYSLKSTNDITSIRMAEYQEACNLLGVKSYHFLDLQDNQSTQWNIDQGVKDLSSLINQLQSTHVISFDSSGGNGHLDHKAISKIAHRVCIQNPHIKYLKVTTFPTNFIKKKFWWLPSKTKNQLIKKLSTSNDKIIDIYKLSRKELKNKMKLLKIYKSQFPDEKGRYYKLPMPLLRMFAKYECYEITS